MLIIQTDGLEAAIDQLMRLQAKGEDLTPLLKYIGEDEVTRTILRFETTTAPDGSPWRGLQKPRQRGGDKPLSDTGRLKGSIRFVLGNNRVTIGTGTEYSIFHQFGTKTAAGKRHIHARPFLGVSDELIHELEDKISDYFQL